MSPNKMKVAVVTGPTFFAARQTIHLANQRGWGVELRLDLFSPLTLELVQSCRDLCANKVLFTWKQPIDDLLFKCLELKPDYLDLDTNTPSEIVAGIRNQFTDIQLISSYHNYSTAPADLDFLLESMQRRHNVHIYKICVTPFDQNDCFKMLSFIKRKTEEGLSVVGICRGKLGQITRTEGSLLGNVFDYQILGKEGEKALLPNFS